MVTVTIHDLPDDVAERIELLAMKNGRTMEQEIRELLTARYASRKTVIQGVRERWDALPTTAKEEIDSWIAEGRSRDC